MRRFCRGFSAGSHCRTAARRSPWAARHTSLGRRDVDAGWRQLQGHGHEFGHLGGPHRLLAAGHHVLEDRQHPVRQPRQQSRRSARAPAFAPSGRSAALEAQRRHGLLVQAGQAALERLGQPALRVRQHDGQRAGRRCGASTAPAPAAARARASTAPARGRRTGAADRTGSTPMSAGHGRPLRRSSRSAPRSSSRRAGRRVIGSRASTWVFSNVPARPAAAALHCPARRWHRRSPAAACRRRRAGPLAACST